MTDRTPSHAGSVHARTDVFLLLVARGQGERALAACPFDWRGGRDPEDNNRPWIELTLRSAPDGSPTVVKSAGGDDALSALRSVVMQVPALAVRLAKIEAVVAQTRAAPPAESPRLTLGMIDYLMGRVRRDLKEKERTAAAMLAKPGQDDTAFAGARRKVATKIGFIYETLDALNTTRDGIARGRRVTDAMAQTAELDGLNLGQLPFAELYRTEESDGTDETHP